MGGSRSGSDEAYVIALCDEILGCSALRQHRFDFLLGDPGRNGARRSLPVDAWYPSLQLVVEYMEIQHFEPVGIMDRRPTVSGVLRGEQRRLYDERRADELPARGISLVRVAYNELQLRNRSKLARHPSDRGVLARKLANYVALGEIR